LFSFSIIINSSSRALVSPVIFILDLVMPRSGYDRTGMAPNAPGAAPYYEGEGSETPRAGPTRVGTPPPDPDIASLEDEDATPRATRSQAELSPASHFQVVRTRLLEILEENQDTIERIRQRTESMRANNTGNNRPAQGRVNQDQRGGL
jgi:hypothetical protein